MNKDRYFSRIKYNGSLNPTLEVLSRLQEAHLLSVPFENLDIHYGVPIELDINKIYKKIILQHRGGFCYELNGLFYELLFTLGFNVKRISARVFDKGNGYGPEYDHLAIIAVFDGIEYLSDVGFGEFCFSPLKLETETMQNDKRGDFIIQKFETDYYLVSKSENGTLLPQYCFETTARELNEFNEMCIYHQTSPQSHFTQNVLITRPTQEGRITLSRNTLKVKSADSINETPIENEYAFRGMLWKYFSFKIEKNAIVGT
jgi:N-hydroxyarylamine O-acetyltransferase